MAKKLVDDLVRSLKDSAEPGDRGETISLLRHISPQRLPDAELLRLHDAALFAAAYPHSGTIEPEAKRCLSGVVREVRRRVRGKPLRLCDSGVLGTQSQFSFGLSSVRWLFEHFENDLDFVWKEAGELGSDASDLILENAPRLDADAVLSEDLSLQALFKRMGPRGRLAFLLAIEGEGKTPAVSDRAFRSLAVDISWSLQSRESARTTNRFPVPTRFTHKELLKYSAEPLAWIKGSRQRRATLSSRRAQRLLDAARAALLVRGRETDPVCDGTSQGVRLYHATRGVDVALFSARPERRRPVESYIGYVAAKNALPIAYGGAWILGDCAEVGVNIFEEYRGGESTYLFAQILGTYHHQLGVNHFYVDPYQFGEGNEEGIQSGAFWFYYRFGFRPLNKRLQALATREFHKLRKNPTYRSGKRTLQQLCGAPLVLSLRAQTPRKINVGKLGLKVCDTIRRVAAGDLAVAERLAARWLTRRLGIFNLDRWPLPEQESFRRLSLLVMSVTSLVGWTKAEKSQLCKTLRAKGKMDEFDYVVEMQRHHKLLAAFRKITAAGP